MMNWKYKLDEIISIFVVPNASIGKQCRQGETFFYVNSTLNANHI